LPRRGLVSGGQDAQEKVCVCVSYELRELCRRDECLLLALDHDHLGSVNVSGFCFSKQMRSCCVEVGGREDRGLMMV
jgi:hypothetical protein